MSEIPKLKFYESVFVENIGNKDEINFVINNHNKEYIITLSSLKEVNAFLDKYKDRPMSFLEDYPEYNEEVNDLLKYYEFLSDKYKLIFRNWLHALLYKVE